MFKVGDKVVHGTSGVCVIDDICTSPFDKNSDRKYYVLTPLFGYDKATVYTPVDGNTAVMRHLSSKEEIDVLIKKIPDTEPIYVETERQRKDTYKAAVYSADIYECVKVIKAVYLRRKSFEKANKHLSNADTDFDALAKKRILDEVAAIFGFSPEDAEAYISEKIKSENI